LPRSLERAFKRSLASFLGFLFDARRPVPFVAGPSPRILVIRQHNQLGDMLCVVPLLRALRAAYPAAFIALMASPVNHDVMLYNRYLDEVIDFDKKRFMGKGRILRFPGYIRSLRSRRFDIALVPSTVSTSFTSDLLAYLSGAKLRAGAGTIDGKENPSAFFLTHRQTLDWRGNDARPQVLRNLDIWPGNLGTTPDLSVEMTLLEDELQWGKSFVFNVKDASNGIIVYHPGAGKTPNRWPADWFSFVANLIAEKHGTATIITAGPMDAEAVSVMVRGLRCPHRIVHNKPIRRVASILHFASLVISNDTGVMHVAAAAGAPVLSLFGPTPPEQWAPIGPRHRYLRGEGGDITTIKPEMVIEAAEEMFIAGGRGKQRMVTQD